MVQRMMELARSLGQVSDQEEGALVCACGAARQELERALRPGVAQADCAEAFALAGAWLALAGLEVSRSAGRVESFTAGDVTVREGSGPDRAGALREQAWRLMAPWTRDRKFHFYGVSGR